MKLVFWTYIWGNPFFSSTTAYKHMMAYAFMLLFNGFWTLHVWTNTRCCSGTAKGSLKHYKDPKKKEYSLAILRFFLQWSNWRVPVSSLHSMPFCSKLSGYFEFASSNWRLTFWSSFERLQVIIVAAFLHRDYYFDVLEHLGEHNIIIFRNKQPSIARWKSSFKNALSLVIHISKKSYLLIIDSRQEPCV